MSRIEDSHLRTKSSNRVTVSDSLLDDLGDVCEAFGVERLELFGSAATGEVKEANDIDFIVRFADRSPGYATRYLDFAKAVEELLDREVDLVTERSIQNPFFCRSVEASRQVLYDRTGREEDVDAGVARC